jgi:hypothetical protein
MLSPICPLTLRASSSTADSPAMPLNAEDHGNHCQNDHKHDPR